MRICYWCFLKNIQISNGWWLIDHDHRAKNKEKQYNKFSHVHVLENFFMNVLYSLFTVKYEKKIFIVVLFASVIIISCLYRTISHTIVLQSHPLMIDLLISFATIMMINVSISLCLYTKVSHEWAEIIRLTTQESQSKIN